MNIRCPVDIKDSNCRTDEENAALHLDIFDLIIWASDSLMEGIMRFENTKKFFVEDLLLDTGNYRFRAANDQKDCIKKIYDQNHDNFIRIMESIGKNDIVQPLIVYEKGSEYVVMDGNRRVAALKVLYNPAKYSPVSTLDAKAKELKSLGKAKFSEILAMCSADKDTIERTLYDIHAAGGGISQIGWNAYANAIYRYRHGLERGKKWYPTAVLLKIEEEFPDWTEFLTGEKFYETFARIFKAALTKGRISESVFSDKGINDNVEETLLNDLYNKSIIFLNAIKNKEISLSRGIGIYASKAGAEDFIENLSLSPDNEKIQGITELGMPERERPNIIKGNGDSSQIDSSSKGITLAADQNAIHREAVSKESEILQDNNFGKKEYGIQRSEMIDTKLKHLNNSKLLNLYNSLCVISVFKHPVLMYVGVWCFF